MKQTIASLKGFLKDNSGATAVEYGLILALLTIAIIGSVGAVSQSNADNFNSVVDSYPA